MSEFWQRIRTRKLFQWAIAYAAAGWVALQVLGFLADNFAWSPAVVRVATVVAGVGLLATLVLAWYHGEQGRQRPGGLELVLLLGLVLVAAVAVGFVLRSDTAPDNASRAAYAELDAKRVAVLPFRNANQGDKESEMLALGIHDDLLTRIPRIRSLRIVSRTSVEEYRGSSKQIGEIAVELGAGAILEGSVQRAGGNVRVNVQLINGKTDEHMWADTYDRPWSLDNLFAIQTEIAEYVARALSAALTPEDRATIAARPTSSEEAYTLYTQARDLLTRDNDERASAQALALVESAVEKDPSFAIAWAMVGWLHVWAYWTRVDRTPERLARAQQAITRALTLEPDLPEAYAAQGLYHYWGHLNYDAAVAEFQRVLKRDPDHADALDWLASVRRRQGRMQEALALFERATAADPRNALIRINVGNTLSMLGRLEQAAAEIRAAKAISPEVWNRNDEPNIWRAAGDLNAMERALASGLRFFPDHNSLRLSEVELNRLRRHYDAALRALARVSVPAFESYSTEVVLVDQVAGDLHRLAGRADSARARYRLAEAWLKRRIAERPNDEFAWSVLGLTYAGLGRKQEAIRAAEHAVALMPVSKEAWNGATRAVQLAAVYTQLGEHDKAIGVLQDLMARPVRVVISPALLRLDLTWDPLRADPRFVALTKLPNALP